METIELGDLDISVTRKDVKNVHLTVHPPEGIVSLVIPLDTRLEIARAYAATRIGWIRQKQEQFRQQAREEPRHFISGESHFVWGRRRLLEVEPQQGRPEVVVSPNRIVMRVDPRASETRREGVFRSWVLSEMHRTVPRHISKWEAVLGVGPQRYFLQKMKTKWGSCNHAAQAIRINTELVKKPRDLLDYVVLHEMIHLIEPKHSDSFFAILSRHYPDWQDARRDLNEMPIPS
ncbi:SprT family zinc-dependent metalloprotease [Pseudohalocynthiibacter sp. F2068]|uniref:M48 family metallopeptidase n=1 Tax=Pseudohalocynthiibacter sp. F2068 TaxID=2926418 RepID=UPI001FF2E2F2|nr:SprT family zinc-dependent metalloprotease [Pseudohalocynthiibacter sp. F2068]MCK0101969.1 M48 family metallopeptidase [Pseudohalocynthiibacter sp. F2068]